MLAGQCTIAFRALELADLSLLHRWLNEPCVLRWYAKHAYSQHEVATKYAPRIEGRDPVHVFIAAADSEPVGLLQTYWLSEFLDYAALVGAAPGWAGVDFFIGEPEYRGRGLGAKLLDQFVREEVFASLKADTCISGPSPNNVKSVRTLQRAAFTYLRTIELSTGEVEHVMIRSSQHAA
jgi:aminoglycoside 6'-N-acetyltransferase